MNEPTLHEKRLMIIGALSSLKGYEPAWYVIGLKAIKSGIDIFEKISNLIPPRWDEDEDTLEAAYREVLLYFGLMETGLDTFIKAHVEKYGEKSVFDERRYHAEPDCD